MKHKVKHIHFVGICGVGMSGIAEVLLHLGYKISGSDLSKNAVGERLIQFGAKVFCGHKKEHIHGADVVVISSAVKEDNPEVVAAKSARIPVIARAMMLAELMRFKQGIAIAGTHGKTTTTSLSAAVFAAANLDPTFVIGGKLLAAGSNAKLGGGDFLLAEADESDASFLHLSPVIAVVTNIDADHMDTYDHDFEKLKQAFIDFLNRLPFYGRAILCLDDANVRAILPYIHKPITTYGTSDDVNICAKNIRACGTQMHFDVLVKNGKEESFSIKLNIPGKHNVLNALAVIALALECGAKAKDIQHGLLEFSGVGRRFQAYGEVKSIDGGQFSLLDDYGHHPAELGATLAAVRGAYPDRRLFLVFQPHRYSRTRDLFEDFVKVLSSVDVLLLTDVYAAGEAPIVAADSRALARAIRVNGKLEPLFVEDVNDLLGAVLDNAQSGDVVITMGAGSISSLAVKIVAAQNKKTSTKKSTGKK